MNIWESRVNLRPRSGFEAADLGLRLFQNRIGLYTALWATFSLPVYALLIAVFWSYPTLCSFLLWWLKPLFEAPILHVLSQQIFADPPNYRQCVRQTWRLLWRPRLIGDLTWRRFSVYRSLMLPIAVLEGATGKAYGQRNRELSRHSGSMATWLTVFGIHLEILLLYAVLITSFWLWFDDPSQMLMGNPFNMMRGVQAAPDVFEWYLAGGADVLLHISNGLYAVILCFWGPIYVACGFTLYLNARTRAEGWDIRLAARKIQQRLLQRSSNLWGILLLALAFVFTPTGYLKAEKLPDEAKIEHIRDTTLSEKPFPHINQKTRYCWRSCTEHDSTIHINEPTTDITANIPNIVNVLLYALAGVVLFFAVRFLLTLYQQSQLKADGFDTPETLFGMKISPESLPADVPAAVLSLFGSDPRAAMSLLYRGSLSQIAHRHGLPLRSSDTEGQVLRRVQQHQPSLHNYWQQLTDAWIGMAYAHRLPEAETVHTLCQQYRRVFGSQGARP